MRDLPWPLRLFSLANCFDVVIFFIFKKYVVSVLMIVWNVWHPVFICAKSFFFFRAKNYLFFMFQQLQRYIFLFLFVVLNYFPIIVLGKIETFHSF